MLRNWTHHLQPRFRVGIYELLMVTDPIRRALQGDGGARSIRAMAVRDGMRTLRMDRARLVRAG